jgi:small-conductance mechanosensitive channel
MKLLSLLTVTSVIILSQCNAFHVVSSNLFVHKKMFAQKTELYDSLNTESTVYPEGNISVEGDKKNSIPAKMKFSFSSINFRFVETFYNRLLKPFIKDPDTAAMTAKICSWVSFAYIILSVLGTFGFDTAPLLSLLSVSGLTIGFAAKDLLSNFFKGFFILFMKPFKRGWTISLNGFTGKVLSIDIRYIKLESSIDKSDILIPIQMAYGSPVIISKKQEY